MGSEEEDLEEGFQEIQYFNNLLHLEVEVEVEEQWVKVYLNLLLYSNQLFLILRNGKRVTTTKTTVTKPDGTTEVSEVIDDGKTK